MKVLSRTKRFTLCMAAACMVAGMVLSGCNDSDSKATATTSAPTLKAGAGSSEIIFPLAMFTPTIEGFSGVINDNPHMRVLVLETDVKVAIVSGELVNIPTVSINLCKQIVSEKTGVPVDNVWVHATHAITTPHYPGNAEHSPDASEVQATYYYNAVRDAITVAAQQAADTLQPAVAGFGTGTCGVNMNRNAIFPDGNYYQGLGGTGLTNKTMTVLRVNSVSSGKPIGFFISYGVKPTCIDNSEMALKTRKVSSDVPGKACSLMEAEFGVPVLFCMPAAADQVPNKWALYKVWDPTANSGAGGAIDKDEGVAKGLEYVQELGTTMGNDAIGIAEKISCTESHQKIAHTEGSFNWASKDGKTVPEVAVGVIRFGDAAFVGFRPELNCATEQQLLDESPYAHTMLISFRDGDQKYMPDFAAYNVGTNKLGTVEGQKAGFAIGAAEELVDVAIDLLNALK